MYNTIKNVINSRRFELADMLRKIDTIWLQGNLTDSEKTELENLARELADESISVDILKKIEDLDKRVRILEGLDKPEVPPTDVDPEYPPFDRNKGYRNGDKVSENGKKYVCQLPEYTEMTYFGPSSYPAYWKEVI